MGSVMTLSVSGGMLGKCSGAMLGSDLQLDISGVMLGGLA